MSFGWFDDGVPSHPKIIRAGAEAAFFWFCSILYSNKHHLDGRISKDLLGEVYTPLRRKAPKLATKLCEVLLWHDRGDYYEIHDYAKHQTSALKEDIEAVREYERARKREARRRQKHGNVPDNVPDSRNSEVPDSVLARVYAPARAPAPANSIPSHTIPSHIPPLPPVGAEPVAPTSGAHGQEVREGWAEAYEQAGAGAPPVLAGQQFAAAVEFARQVARTHGKPLRYAARAIAAATLASERRDERVWGLSRLDPFAASDGQPGRSLSPLAQQTLAQHKTGRDIWR